MTDAADERSQASISIEGRAPGLPAHLSRELFLIASEAVRNAIDHGEASSIEIEWFTEDGSDMPFVTLEVRDNGSGLPPDAGYRTGRGIAIMRHRASVIDGSFEIAPAEGGGTRVRCRAPIPTANEWRSDEGTSN